MNFIFNQFTPGAADPFQSQQFHQGELKPNETEIFFKTLWGDNPPDKGFIVLWTKQDNRSYFFSLNQKQDLIRKVEQLKSMGDVYFTVGLQKLDLPNGKRGTSETVIALPGVWVDIDVQGPDHKKRNLIPTMDAALDFINGLPLKPTLIINTGGGYHCYWMLKTPLLFSRPKTRQEAKHLSENFQKTIRLKAQEKNWHIDNTSDLARVLRIPGTDNCKSLPARPVHIVDAEGPRYTPGDIEKFISENNRTKTLITPPAAFQPPKVETVPVKEPDTVEEDDSDNINRKVVRELINRCDFLKHCRDDAAALSEPEWYKMICILSREAGGPEAIHELSKPYPGYSKQETNDKILNALDRCISPITCKSVRETWPCQKDCGVTCPIHLKKDILGEMGIQDASYTAYQPMEPEKDPDDEFSDMDLLKERTPDMLFPWDSLPPLLSASLKDLAEDMAVQPEMCAVTALGILSAAIGSNIESVEAKKGYKAPVNIWTAILAETGGKKTPVIGRLMKPVHAIQKQLHDEYEDAHKNWVDRQKNNQDSKTKSNDDPEPKFQSIYTTDPTIEALIELLNNNEHGVMLNQDEMSAFLLGFNKYRGGKGGDREQYLNLWSATPIKIDRVSKQLYVYRPFLTLLGGIQPGKAKLLFGDDSFDDGLITRFLFYRNDDIYNDLTSHEWRVEHENLWARLVQSLYTARYNPKLKLKLSQNAWNIFMDYENYLTRRKQFDPGKFKVFLPKASNYVLRISGILHAVEAAMNNQHMTLEVSAATVNRAVNLANYFLSQARKIIELYGPQKPQIDSNQKQVLKTILSIYNSKNNSVITTEEIQAEFNSSVPEGVQSTNLSSFGSLVRKTLKDNKIKFEKKRPRLNGKDRKAIVLEKTAIKAIEKLLKQ